MCESEAHGLPGASSPGGERLSITSSSSSSSSPVVGEALSGSGGVPKDSLVLGKPNMMNGDDQIALEEPAEVPDEVADEVADEGTSNKSSTGFDAPTDDLRNHSEPSTGGDEVSDPPVISTDETPTVPEEKSTADATTEEVEEEEDETLQRSTKKQTKEEEEEETNTSISSNSKHSDPPPNDQVSGDTTEEPSTVSGGGKEEEEVEEERQEPAPPPQVADEACSSSVSDVEGVDPFSMKPAIISNLITSERRLERRGSKTVSFREPERRKKTDEVDGGATASSIQNGTTSSSTSSSKNGSSSNTSSSNNGSSSNKGDLPDDEEEEGGETEEEEEEERGGTMDNKKPNKQWTLGEGNPVYRLSLKLSPNLFNMVEIPGASQHREAEKAGYLTKLSGRSFPYIATQWKRRYCVLAKGRLYYYEREDSRAGDKNNGVINLDYFDHVAEAGPKECKKATNVFIITSQDRSFFDPGRHLFSADTLPDMRDWVRRLQSALEQIRNNNRTAAANCAAATTTSSTTSKSTKESGKRRKEENTENKENGVNKEGVSHSSTKERKRKKEESQRSRKSTRPGVSSETQTMAETQTPGAGGAGGTTTEQQEVTTASTDKTTTPSTKVGGVGVVQLPGMTSSHRGIQLPGLSSMKETQQKETQQKAQQKETPTIVVSSLPKEASKKRRSKDEGKEEKKQKQEEKEGEEEAGEEGGGHIPSSGPPLNCITKHRVKGPQGRRAPQSRRLTSASSLKQRASSLSALEYQDLSDNSETPWLNRSLDVLEDGVTEGGTRNKGRGGGRGGASGGMTTMMGPPPPPPALPYKAYNYSTDEDEMDDDNETHSQSDSFPASASTYAMHPPPPPPPRSASYGVEYRRHHFHHHHHQGLVGRQALHHSLGDERGSQGDLCSSNRSLGSFGGSKRSLGDIGGSKRSLGDCRAGEWPGWPEEESAIWGGSRGSLGQNGEVSGGASPVMDDLENLLMNQSVQHTSAAPDTASEGGSEGSTCRAADHHQSQQQQLHHHHHHHCHHQQKQQHLLQQKAQQQPEGRKKSQNLNRFATAVRHLQRHVVEIDRAVFGISSDVAGTQREMSKLKGAVMALQTDTDTITATLSTLTQEAITAQQKVTFAAQEAERVQHAANMALREAETAKKEQLKTQKEYQELVAEMRIMLKEFQDAKDAVVTQPQRTVTATTPETQSRSAATPGSSGSHAVSATTESQGGKKHGSQGQKTHISSTGSTAKSAPEHKITRTAEASSLTDASTITEYQPPPPPIQLVKSSTIGGSINTGGSSSLALPIAGTPPTTVSSGTLGTQGSNALPATTQGTASVKATSTATQGTSTTKTTGYQSLFSKSSSIISGLTSRHALSKSVSFADQKDKEKRKSTGSDMKVDVSEAKKPDDKHQDKKDKKDDKSHQSSHDKKDDKYHPGSQAKEKSGDKQHKDEKHENTLEKKQKKESKHSTTGTSSIERKSKEKKDKTDRKDSSSIDRKDRKGRHHDGREKRSNLQDARDSEHVISQLSLEDIPMADDNIQDLLDHPRVSEATTSSATTSTDTSKKLTLNFSLGKSSSSPTVSYVAPTTRPRALPLNRDRKRSEHSISCASSSPESPTAPTAFPRLTSTLPPVDEGLPLPDSRSLCSLHRPGSTPGPLSRQGSMTTVPENQVVTGSTQQTNKRPGVFAISRQHSSPNIPLQRQNSAPIFPIQRQQSMGMVPEEGRLPRQESLMSVPEERPIVDQTLPLSPSQSITHFPLSPTTSSSTLSEAARRSVRESMELVTGPVLAGSSLQEAAATGTLPVLHLTEEDEPPSATSTLKKDHKPGGRRDGILV